MITYALKCLGGAMLFTLPHFILQIKALLLPEHVRTALCCPSFFTVPVFISKIRPKHTSSLANTTKTYDPFSALQIISVL